MLYNMRQDNSLCTFESEADMADPLTPIINQLSNLVSFKSALRLLLIACGVILCWINAQPYIEKYNLPNELAITLVTIVGFSLGALTSVIIFSTFDLIKTLVSIFFKKRKDNKEKKEKSDLLAIQESERISVFKKSLEEYSFEAMQILLVLSIKDKAIQLNGWADSPTNIAFRGLQENKIIIILEAIDKKTFFCTINPFFKKVIVDYFNKKHTDEINILISSENEGFKVIMELFKKKEKEEMHVFELGIDVYSERYFLTPVIKHEEYEINEFKENCNIQFYIENHYHKLLEEITHSELRYCFLANFDDKRMITDIHQ